MLPNLLVCTFVKGRLQGLWLKVTLGAADCGSPQTACCGRTVESVPVTIFRQCSVIRSRKSVANSKGRV